MKRILITFFVLFLLFGCAQNAPSNQNSTNPSQNPSTNSSNSIVKISNFSFQPKDLAVKSGTTVKWINEDSVPHSIKSDSFNSQTLSNGQSFEFTFNNTGTFNYSCSIHPSMTGTITVQ